MVFSIRASILACLTYKASNLQPVLIAILEV